MNGKVKSGYTTTEFWLTLISQVVPVLVLTGVLNPDESAAVQDTASNTVIAGFAFAQAVVTLIAYVIARVKVKTDAARL